MDDFFGFVGVCAVIAALIYTLSISVFFFSTPNGNTVGATYCHKQNLKFERINDFNEIICGSKIED